MARDKICTPFLALASPENKFTVNTIEDMQSRKYLKIGDVVELLGYYTAGDGAGHKRKIEATDDGSGVQLANGLWANIVHNGEVNVSWFGAKVDSDCLYAMNKLSSYVEDSQKINIDIDLILNFVEGSTIYSPTRILFKNKKNIIINGNNKKITMTGCTEDYLRSIDDLNSSGRDIFTAFSFMRCKNSKILDLEFHGTYVSGRKFRYVSPRAKCVGFIGCEDMVVDNLTSYGVLGNVVNATPTMMSVDGEGEYLTCKKIKVLNCKSYGSWENAFNFMGGTAYSSVDGCTSFGAGSSCVEIGGDNNTVSNCFSIGDKIGFVSGSTAGVIINCGVKESKKDEEGISGVGIRVTASDCDIINCKIAKTESSPIEIYGNSTRVRVMGCFVEIGVETVGIYNFGVYTSGTTCDLVFVNNVFNNMSSNKLFLLRCKSLNFSNNKITSKNPHLVLTTKVIESLNNIVGNIIESEGKILGVETGGSQIYLNNNILNGKMTNSNGALEPTLTSVGDFFYNTVNKKLKLWNGAEWIEVYTISNLSVLDTPYLTAKMQQEGVYEDFIQYMDEKTEYDRLQRETENQPEGVMVLPAIEEPQPSEKLLAFKTKYLG